MIPIDGLIVKGLCPPPILRPKNWKCVPYETPVPYEKPAVPTQIGENTPETVTAFLLDNSYQILRDGPWEIKIEVDPLIEKSVKLELTFEIAGLEPAGLEPGFDA